VPGATGSGASFTEGSVEIAGWMWPGRARQRRWSRAPAGRMAITPSNDAPRNLWGETRITARRGGTDRIRGTGRRSRSMGCLSQRGCLTAIHDRRVRTTVRRASVLPCGSCHAHHFCLRPSATALEARLWTPRAACRRCCWKRRRRRFAGKPGQLAEGFVETGAVARVALVGTGGPMMPNDPPRWKRRRRWRPNIAPRA
jgi:hypothetical protein